MRINFREVTQNLNSFSIFPKSTTPTLNAQHILSCCCCCCCCCRCCCCCCLPERSCRLQTAQRLSSCWLVSRLPSSRDTPACDCSSVQIETSNRTKLKAFSATATELHSQIVHPICFTSIWVLSPVFLRFVARDDVTEGDSPHSSLAAATLNSKRERMSGNGTAPTDWLAVALGAGKTDCWENKTENGDFRCLSGT